jgi:cysteine desulfurase/selenocysteine lyase
MSLVPRQVLRTVEGYYSDYPGCGGRSLHRYAQQVSQRFEGARERFARFFGVADSHGVVFVRNATEAINLVAQGTSWKKGDRVLVSDQEHNSNLVVWQRLVRERGIRLDFLPLSPDGTFDGDLLEQKLARRVRMVSLFHTSNLDGRTLPLPEVVERAHDRGAQVLFDGCQAAPHRAFEFDRTGVDYYAISAHKMLGPTGTGVLLGRLDALATLRPMSVGGESVEWTTLTDHQLRGPPHRFEAGLQNYAGVIGAAAGLDYLERVGWDTVEATQLVANRVVSREFADEPRVRVLGPPDPKDRSSVFAFALDGIDPHDAALFLDQGYRVLVRSGMHCVHSWYERRGLAGNVRASFYFYNDRTDANRLARGVRELLERIPPGPSSARAVPIAAK